MKFYNLRDTATGLFWETISGTWIEKGSQPVEPTVYDQDDVDWCEENPEALDANHKFVEV